MAYLHCLECGWAQSDFWSKDCNPLSRLEKDGVMDALLSEKWLVVSADWLYQTDFPFREVRVSRALRQRDENEPTVLNQPESALIEYEQYEIEPKAYVAYVLRIQARDIENMRWRTKEEWQRDKDNGQANCPQCGSSEDLYIN
jgi:hypothetical protein